MVSGVNDLIAERDALAATPAAAKVLCIRTAVDGGWRSAADVLAEGRQVMFADAAELGAPGAFPRLTGDGKAVLLGAGEGAQTALELALACPEQVEKVLLITPLLKADLDLAAVAAATIVLVGADDKGPAIESARRCRALMPECHMMLVYAAGADIAAARPAAVRDAFQAFLELGELFPVRTESHRICD